MLRWTPRELREKKGLSQAETADGIGMSRSYYNEIENGDRLPSFRMARRIADFFGVPLDSIHFPAMEYAKREQSPAAGRRLQRTG